MVGRERDRSRNIGEYGIMKKLSLITLGVLLASGAAAEEINQTKDAQADGRVDVSNLSGSVEVTGWDRNKVEITGEIGDDVDNFIFEVSGKHTTIKVKVPDRSWGKKDVTSELVIRVPHGSSLEVGTVSADIDVEDVRGEQELQSVSGDITAQAFDKDIQAESVSGDVDIEGGGKRAEWDLSSVSGDVSATGLSGDIDVEVVSGDIVVNGQNYSRVRLESVNGDIEIGARLDSGGRMDVETVNGSVDIEFEGEVSARFEVESFNGRIRNCFGPEPRRTSKYAPGWELEFSVGGGDGRVSVATLNGGIRICNE